MISVDCGGVYWKGECALGLWIALLAAIRRGIIRALFGLLFIEKEKQNNIRMNIKIDVLRKWKMLKCELKIIEKAHTLVDCGN